MEEKQKHRHNVMAPHSSLRERGWGKRAPAPLAQVLCQVWCPMLPCRCGQLFSLLCASGSCAEAESYHEKNELLFLPAWCLPGSSTEFWSVASLSPQLGTQHGHILVTKRQNLIGTGNSLLSCPVTPALKHESWQQFSNSLHLPPPLPCASWCQCYHI